MSLPGSIFETAKVLSTVISGYRSDYLWCAYFNRIIVYMGGYIALYYGYRLSAGRAVKFIEMMPYGKNKMSPKYIHGIILLLLSFLLLTVVAYMTVGVSEWLRSPREGYESSRVGYGIFYNTAINIGCLGFGLMLISSSISKSKRLFIFFLYGCFFYLLGSKMHVLNFVVGILGASSLKEMPHSKYKAIGILSMGAIPLYLLFMASYEETGLYGDIIQTAVRYFDHYKLGSIYFEHYYNGGVPLLYGEVYMSDFWRAIPRILYPGKPELMGITIINDLLGIGDPKAGWTPTIGGGVEYYADFGFFGTIILSIFSGTNIAIGFFYGLLGYGIKTKQLMRYPYMFICIVIINASYNSFFVFPVNILFTVIMYYFIFNILRMKMYSSRSPELTYDCVSKV
jgi:hypothetical protein